MIPHLYLDTLGLVTCDVGQMIPSPEAMAGIEMVCSTGERATIEQRLAEWARTN